MAQVEPLPQKRNARPAAREGAAGVWFAAIVVLVVLLCVVCSRPHELLGASVVAAPVGWAWPLAVHTVTSGRNWGKSSWHRPANYDYSSFVNYITGPSNMLVRASSTMNKPIFSRKDMDVLFPQHRMFEAAHPQIREEALSVLELGDSVPEFQKLDGAHARISQGNSSSPGEKRKTWRTFVFKFYGPENAENCARCPVTASLIRRCPTMKAAMFSILDPGFKISPHRGPNCASLRYHLGVIIPDAQLGQTGCYIRVDNNPYFWRNGEGVLFDDTYVHEALNDTSRRRVVLFCDVQRTDLTPTAMAVENTLLNDPVVQKYFAKYNRKNERATSL